MFRVQARDASFLQKQEKALGAFATEKALPILPQAHSAQRNQVTQTVIATPMIINKTAYGLLLIVFALPLLGASCGRPPAEEKEPKAGPAVQLRQFLKKGQKQAVEIIRKGSANLGDLSDEQKKAIDEWLARNKLNQYGDALDAVYAGGTPLFDEKTGATVNRYEYLFKKFPELKEIIKKASDEQAK